MPRRSSRTRQASVSSRGDQRGEVLKRFKDNAWTAIILPLVIAAFSTEHFVRFVFLVAAVIYATITFRNRHASASNARIAAFLGGCSVVAGGIWLALGVIGGSDQPRVRPTQPLPNTQGSAGNSQGTVGIKLDDHSSFSNLGHGKVIINGVSKGIEATRQSTFANRGSVQINEASKSQDK